MSHLMIVQYVTSHNTTVKYVTHLLTVQ